VRVFQIPEWHLVEFTYMRADGSKVKWSEWVHKNDLYSEDLDEEIVRVLGKPSLKE